MYKFVDYVLDMVLDKRQKAIRTMDTVHDKIHYGKAFSHTSKHTIGNGAIADHLLLAGGHADPLAEMRTFYRGSSVRFYIVRSAHVFSHRHVGGYR